MNLVEVSEVWVEAGWAETAEDLLSKRPDLFGGATSYSEPLRYSRGMRRRLEHAPLPAKIGYWMMVALLAGFGLFVLGTLYLGVSNP